MKRWKIAEISSFFSCLYVPSKFSLFFELFGEKSRTLKKEQPDGSLIGSPFHVNFGFRSVLHATEKKVYITVNGIKSEISMKLGKSGEAFFVKVWGCSTKSICLVRSQLSFKDINEDSELAFIIVLKLILKIVDFLWAKTIKIPLF